MSLTDTEKRRKIRELLSKVKSLEQTINEVMQSSGQENFSSYSSYKSMAIMFNELVDESKLLNLIGSFHSYDIDKMPNWADATIPSQKELMVTVLMSTRFFKNTLESNIDLVYDEVERITNFLSNKLRAVIRNSPQKEYEIQEAIENLFIGSGMQKGSDYDREAGEIKYSGRKYIPDFVIKSLNMCIEVKLLKEAASRAKSIEEINADITAYSTQYPNILFVVYDVGIVRDVEEYRRDISKNIGVKIIIIKH